ncbi:hypothetical protein Clacol_005491 [Clathrus columnatus]|uniref:Crinkler effector protein N-terminal domain-containing protein n=1 Tax=Clathrus columnatus TaxID=1419009 RepID=A0AAV5AEY5_9AGAM|nr:hypothetical protein Clacol_005491 [Clathrus columnatus]
MSENIELFCYVIGTPANDVFVIQIPSSRSIAHLKVSIRDKLKPRFDNIPANELLLWKVSIALDDNFQQNIDSHNFEDTESLLAVKRLSDLFPQPPNPEHVHIVVRRPQLVSAVPPAQVQNQINLRVTNNFVLDDEQYDEENPAAIHDGRYGTHRNTTLAPPLELYHPVFAEFKAHLNNPTLELPPDVVLNTMELMVATSEIKTLESERINVRGIVEKLCGLAIMKSENKDETKPDYIFPVTRNSPPIEVALVAVVEEKSELGVNGDPTVQASFSYIHYWADPSHQLLRTSSCCPSFIIGIAGPWVSICGGVLTGHPIVQRLTDYIWLGHSRIIDEAYTLRVAKIFYSLRLAAGSLYAYYLNSEFPLIKKSRIRFFPSITSYKVGVQTVRFEYLRPLEPEDADDKLIVVKFAERYGEQAHRLLAAEKLAPELLYFGPLTSPQEAVKYSYGNLYMVVMEYIEGCTVQQKFPTNTIPLELKKVVQKARECLSKASLVHGDLRKPNILIPKKGGIEGALIIDFDWAGEANKVRYPLHLSSAPGLWVDGVEPYGLIQAVHDDAMVDRL